VATDGADELHMLLDRFNTLMATRRTEDFSVVIVPF
jgi:hypothetical protein